jgi:hypothetical protein
MSFKKNRIYTLVLAAIVVMGAGAPAQAADATAVHSPSSKTLTIEVNGTLGPILSGSDPLGLNGQGGTLTMMAKESLKPKKHTSNSATYILPAGAVVVTVGTNKFQTTTPSTMQITLTSTADILTLTATGPDQLKVVGTSDLQAGSWTKSVLKHPGLFQPSPQNLTAAQKANGPGSKVKYTIFGSATVLGLSGTASCSD